MNICTMVWLFMILTSTCMTTICTGIPEHNPSLFSRYVQRTFRRALQHVRPDVIVILGDVFDEGSISTNEEYERYLKRFKRIFRINADIPVSPERQVHKMYSFVGHEIHSGVWRLIPPFGRICVWVTLISCSQQQCLRIQITT